MTQLGESTLGERLPHYEAVCLPLAALTALAVGDKQHGGTLGPW